MIAATRSQTMKDVVVFYMQIFPWDNRKRRSPPDVVEMRSSGPWPETEINTASGDEPIINSQLRVKTESFQFYVPVTRIIDGQCIGLNSPVRTQSTDFDSGDNWAQSTYKFMFLRYRGTLFPI